MASPILRPASVAACNLMRSLLEYLLVAVVAVSSASNAAPAATISSGVDDHGNHFLTLDGPIGAGDPDRLAAAILEANDRGYRLDALRLNSRGGLLWEAMAMAVMVRWVKNMATVVRSGAKM
jgi:membrane-bound ClpP family serine protease